jgi:hypothetical protein
MLQDIVETITLKNGTHAQREASHLFSHTTHKDEWILSSLEIIFVPWQTLSFSIRLI